MRQARLIFLYLSRTLGVFRLSRWLYRNKVLILCYHGGAKERQHEYNGMLYMRRQTFAHRMDLLSNLNIGCMTLDALQEEFQKNKRRSGKRRSPRVVLTFDDGWESTFTDLIPELQSRQLPATIYLHTRPVIEQKKLTHLFFRYQVWTELNEERVHQGLEPFPGMDDWKSDTDKRALEIEADRRSAKANDTPHDATNGNVSAFAYASPDQLRDSASLDGVRLEAHGHDHHHVQNSPEALRNNFQSCSDAFLALNLPLPRHYCYPSGEYDKRSGQVLSELGVISATTCDAGWINPIKPGNKYYLPRFLDSERYTLLEFEAELSGFMDLMRRAIKPRGDRDDH